MQGGGGGSSALDSDFRHIIRQIPLEDKRDLILQYGDEASKRRAHNTTADGKAGDVETKVGGRWRRRRRRRLAAAGPCYFAF